MWRRAGGEARAVGQRLADHRPAHNDVGGVDVAAHETVGSALGQKAFQNGVDASAH